MIAQNIVCIVGDKGRLSQDEPLWYKDYFELKATKTQQIQEKFFTSFLNYLIIIQIEVLLQEESYHHR